jgi:hypothetical protein
MTFIAAIVGIVWVMNGFVGLGTHGVIALVLGTVLSAGLGVGLMGLVFFSARSGADDHPEGRAATGRDRRP